MRHSRVRTQLSILALLALLAACGSEDPATTDDGSGEPDPVTEPAPDDEAVVDEPATVAVGTTDLGDVLVDAAGMTLYVFDPDAQGSSTCVDGCAASWPPLLDDTPVAGDGVDAGLLGTATRDDGSEQVTYDGWPLYTWAADSSPGEATGQGVQDVWWVMDADGTVIRGEEPESESEPEPSGGTTSGGPDY